MMGNSNIRYHIFKELFKYQQRIGTNKKSILADITIPIYSGVITIIIAPYANNFLSNVYWNIIFLLCIYPILFIFIWLCERLWRKHIKPFLYPIETQAKSKYEEEQEILSAKFHYEVTYLVSLTYKELLCSNSSKLLSDFKIIETCFRLQNAIRKTRESLMKYPYALDEFYVSHNKVRVILDLMYDSILKLRKIHCENRDYISEIDNVQLEYDELAQSMGIYYKTKYKIFNTISK